VGLRLPRASEHGDLVTKCEELDLLGIVTASREDGELEQAADDEVDECPHPSSHPADTSRSRLDLEVRLQQCKLPCPSRSMARPRFRTPYFDWVWTIETFRSP